MARIERWLADAHVAHEMRSPLYDTWRALGLYASGILMSVSVVLDNGVIAVTSMLGMTISVLLGMLIPVMETNAIDREAVHRGLPRDRLIAAVEQRRAHGLLGWLQVCEARLGRLTRDSDETLDELESIDQRSPHRVEALGLDVQQRIPMEGQHVPHPGSI